MHRSCTILVAYKALAETDPSHFAVIKLRLVPAPCSTKPAATFFNAVTTVRKDYTRVLPWYSLKVAFEALAEADQSHLAVIKLRLVPAPCSTI